MYRDDPELIACVTDETRGAFLELLDLGEQQVVLEIGPGDRSWTRPVQRKMLSMPLLPIQNPERPS